METNDRDTLPASDYFANLDTAEHVRGATRLRDAFRFFFEHAGYVVGRRAEGALTLARAEAEAARRDLYVLWEPDNDADMSWLADAPRSVREADHFAEYAEIRDEGGKGRTLASLGGIVDADATYRRIVAAELAVEALAEIHKEERSALGTDE